MSLFRKQSPKVLQWNPVPGKPLPEPVIKDDRDKFTEGTVRHVLQWLNQLRPEFEKLGKPTEIIVRIDREINARTNKVTNVRLKVEYGRGPLVPMGVASFRPCTEELLLKSRRRGLIEAKYTYLAARDERGRCIVGPLLRFDRTAQMVILAS